MADASSGEKVISDTVALTVTPLCRMQNLTGLEVDDLGSLLISPAAAARLCRPAQHRPPPDRHRRPESANDNFRENGDAAGGAAPHRRRQPFEQVDRWCCRRDADRGSVGPRPVTIVAPKRDQQLR